ncbi:hypothetical protein K435DRAFT_834544, partial [Dendrothele bispora CBS 962.96]
MTPRLRLILDMYVLFFQEIRIIQLLLYPIHNVYLPRVKLALSVISELSHVAVDCLINEKIHTSPNYIDDRLQDWQRLYYGEHYPQLERLKLKRLKAVLDPSDAFGFPTAIALRTQYVCLRSFLDKKIHARSYIEGDNINNKVDGNWKAFCAGGSVATSTTAFYGGLAAAHRFHACKPALQDRALVIHNYPYYSSNQ